MYLWHNKLLFQNLVKIKFVLNLNRFATDNCQIVNISPVSSDFSQHQEPYEAIVSLGFCFFMDLIKTCLTSDHATAAGYPYTCLHSAHSLLLFIC